MIETEKENSQTWRLKEQRDVINTGSHNWVNTTTFDCRYRSNTEITKWKILTIHNIYRKEIQGNSSTLETDYKRI